MNQASAPAVTREASGIRRKPGRRSGASVPDLARRGRTTMRHLTALFLGGYIAWVEARRDRGMRGLIFRLHSLLAWLCRLFVNREYTRLPFPAQMRLRLEKLGPTYIKLGQMLSLRSDILPEVITSELMNLLSDLPPAPFDEICHIIEDDLGRPLEEVFSFIDPSPIGSASIAQTHKATIRDGETVILKVVKPGIRDLLYRDADLIRFWGAILQLLAPRFQARKVIDEFFEYTLLEVEMLREADNSEVFAANFRDVPDIAFPTVHREYSGPNVLCMEYFVGPTVDAEAVRSLPADERQRLVDLGASAIIRMLYEDGFFHADLHPGNVVVLPGNRIGFIDLGMVGKIDADLRRSLLHHFYCLVEEDFENAARHLADVAQLEQTSDTVGFRRGVKDLCRKWRRSASFEEFSVGQLILESIRLGARHQMYFPMEMVLLVKALVTYEGVGHLLDPDFNVVEVSQRHVGRIMRLHFSPLRLLREGLRGAPDLVDAASKLPVLVSESLRVLERRARRRPEGPFNGLRATVFGGFCLVAGAILAAVDGPLPVWVGLMLVGVLVAARRGR